MQGVIAAATVDDGVTSLPSPALWSFFVLGQKKDCVRFFFGYGYSENKNIDYAE